MEKFGVEKDDVKEMIVEDRIEMMWEKLEIEKVSNEGEIEKEAIALNSQMKQILGDKKQINLRNKNRGVDKQKYQQKQKKVKQFLELLNKKVQDQLSSAERKLIQSLEHVKICVDQYMKTIQTKTQIIQKWIQSFDLKQMKQSNPEIEKQQYGDGMSKTLKQVDQFSKPSSHSRQKPKHKNMMLDCLYTMYPSIHKKVSERKRMQLSKKQNQQEFTFQQKTSQFPENYSQLDKFRCQHSMKSECGKIESEVLQQQEYATSMRADDQYLNTIPMSNPCETEKKEQQQQTDFLNPPTPPPTNQDFSPIPPDSDDKNYLISKQLPSSLHQSFCSLHSLNSQFQIQSVNQPRFRFYGISSPLESKLFITLIFKQMEYFESNGQQFSSIQILKQIPENLSVVCQYLDQYKKVVMFSDKLVFYLKTEQMGNQRILSVNSYVLYEQNEQEERERQEAQRIYSKLSKEWNRLIRMKIETNIKCGRNNRSGQLQYIREIILKELTSDKVLQWNSAELIRIAQPSQFRDALHMFLIKFDQEKKQKRNKKKEEEQW